MFTAYRVYSGKTVHIYGSVGSARRTPVTVSVRRIDAVVPCTCYRSIARSRASRTPHRWCSVQYTYRLLQLQYGVSTEMHRTEHTSTRTQEQVSSETSRRRRRWATALSSSAHARTTQDPDRARHGSLLPAALSPRCSNTHRIILFNSRSPSGQF